MAPKTLRASQPTQIQKRTPRRLLRSGWLCTVDSSTSSLTKKLLTADPWVDDAREQIAREIDQDDADGDDEHDALDDQIVASPNGGDELVAEAGNGENVLHDEASGEQPANVDPGRAEQRHRRRSKGMAPHDAPLADA